MSENVTLEIAGPDRPAQRFEVGPGIYTVGSEESCRIRLNHESVEERHAILTLGSDGNWVEDLDTPGATRIGGEPVRGRARLDAGRELTIGDFTLVIVGERVSPPPSVPVPQPETAPPPPLSPEPRPPAAEPSVVVEDDERRHIKRQIHAELVKRLDLKRLTVSHVRQEDLKQKAVTAIGAIVEEVRDRLPRGLEPSSLIKEITDEALGLGPLEDFLADPDITEIMVNGHRQVYIERNGRLLRTDKTFMNDASVLAIIERIVSPLGRRIDESQPYVDARLADGSRVNAIIHPLSLIGPCITIRKFSKTPFTDEDLVRFGTLPAPLFDFAMVCVRLRKNIVVSGGTGSGKTTLLNVLSGYLPEDERIVTIEDAAELRLGQEHIVRLEARPPNIEGKGAVTIRDLVRNALRMRPDRIVVGECRGGEALDMLQAMNTGHDGSLTTVHANSPRDVISRLETMVLMSGMDLPVRAIREQIASAVDVIVHESRFSDGSRKVTRIAEIVGLEGAQITMQDLFEFTQTGLDENGRVVGHFRPTGAVPTFAEEIEKYGLVLDRRIFNPDNWDNGEFRGASRADGQPGQGRKT